MINVKIISGYIVSCLRAKIHGEKSTLKRLKKKENHDGSFLGNIL